MLNRYFKADGNNPDFLYANISVQNIYFALISLDHIFIDAFYNVGIYHDEHTYYFFHLQSLLTACGNISNVFYNHGGFGGKDATQRSARLRKSFNITKKEFSLIFQKEFRNTNEHFDERLEQFGYVVGDLNILDENTEPYMRTVINTNPHLRTFDKENYTYITYNRKLQPITYDLRELREELNIMLERITTNPAFEEGWITEMTGEIIKN